MPYSPRTWVTGDTVTAADMNAIENGIADAAGGLEGITALGDASATLSASTTAAIIEASDPITATRSVTLPNNPDTQDDITVIRTADATGAFALQVKNHDGSTLYDLIYSTSGIWAQAHWDGTDWQLIKVGYMAEITIPDNSAALGSATPASLAGSGSPGSSASGSHEDHVHPYTGLVLSSQMGAASGVADLDASGYLKSARISGTPSTTKVVGYDGSKVLWVVPPTTSTGRIVLPVAGGIAPDGTGTGNNAAGPEKVVSSGSQTSNTPKLSYIQLTFDQSTDEHWEWAFPLPADYVSGGVLRLTWGAKVTTGNVIWKAGIKASVLSSVDMDAAVYLAADVSSATAVPGTVGISKETTITLTVTGLAATTPVSVFVGRDADAGGDTAAGDACLVGVVFEYATV